VGAVAPGHEADESLTGAVLLENAAAKVTGALALRRLLARGAPEPVDFLLGSGEEAVGDRYQRGGGNLARAMGELAEVRGAGGADVKAFCAGPVHALIMAGAMVQSGLHRRVVVVAGGSLAKIGMKFLGHLSAGYPILEDVLVGVAIDVGPDDGVSPRLRLDTAATLRLGDGDAPHQVATVLTDGAAPEERAPPVRRRPLRGRAAQPRHHGAGGLGRRAGQQLPDHRGAGRPGRRDRAETGWPPSRARAACRGSRPRRATSPRRCRTCRMP
jgi:hypothetical protein